MKKLSLASLLFKKNLSRNERNTNATRARAPRTRALQLESLETRELLSVAPGSEFLASADANIRGFISSRFTVEEAVAAYEAAAATRADDVVAVPADAFDAPDVSLVADAPNSPSDPPFTVAAAQLPALDQTTDNFAVSAAAGVTGPGKPSVYYDADKSDFNKEDDDLCWAATASNMLWYTGWASVTNAQNEQEFFDTYFVNSWTDKGYSPYGGISWFMNDDYTPSDDPDIAEPKAHAGYYSQLMGQNGESPSNYLSSHSARNSDALQKLSSSLTSGDAVGLSLVPYTGSNPSHAITCWGYTVDKTGAYSSTDPRYYTGLYITDSDDEKNGKNDDELNYRKLEYVTLEWRDNLISSDGEVFCGYLLDYSGRTGDDRYYLSSFSTLKQRPEKYASADAIEPRSTVVTTTDDVYDIYDGKISLREAINNAYSGATVTFADSLKGKTITLNSEKGELKITKSITIDASSLWNASTSSPGLTISGGGATRIIELDAYQNVEIDGLALANGYVAKASDGGAIANWYSTLILKNCAIHDNQAFRGAGVFSYNGDTTLINCVVTNNTARNGGGAVYSYSSDSYCTKTTLVNCTVTNNNGYYGGGISGSSYSTINVYNAIVYGNSSDNSGAADVYLDSSTVVVNAYNTLSSFTNWTNRANNLTNLTYNSSKPLFANAASGNYKLASNSQAIDKGEDLYVATNVDFAGNKRISGEKVDLGAYEYQFNGDLETLPTPANVTFTESNGSINASWETVQGATGYRVAYRTSNGAYTTVDVAANKTSYSITGLQRDETYSLKVAAIGNGSTRRTSYYSPEISVRIPTTIVVTSATDVVNENDGVVTLREALSSAKTGDTITFASSLKGKTITVSSALEDLEVAVSVTIDASSLYTASSKTPGITLSGGNSTRIMWVYGGYSVSLKGLKFANGRAPECGGAIWNNGELTVENCVFADNIAMYKEVEGGSYGGAIAVKPGATLTAKSSTFTGNNGGGAVSSQTERSVSLVDCEFKNNVCDGLVINSGQVSLTNCDMTGNKYAGIEIRGGEVSMTSCDVVDNKSYGVETLGGEISLTNCNITGNTEAGIYIYDLSPTYNRFHNGNVSITNCDVVGNDGFGIALSSNTATLTVSNTLIAGNSTYWGAGLYLAGKATLYNCTITGNTATYGGGGVNLNANAVLTAYNTIIAGNTASSYPETCDVDYSSGAVANAYNTLSSYTDWTSGSNNVTYSATKPLFKNASSGDYTLAANSQAIDKGNDQNVTTSVDRAGNPRKSGSKVDIGAYEYQFDDDPEPLSTPTNFRSTAKTTSTITVAWNAVANASGYAVSYKLATASNWTDVYEGTDRSYTIKNLSSETKYDVRVVAKGDDVNYSDSNPATITVTTPEPDPTPVLSTPTNPRKTASTYTTITVAWNAVANASGYKLAWRNSTASTFAYVDINSASTTSYKLTGLNNSASYVWQVLAVGDGTNYANSEYTAAQTVRPLQTLSAPTVSYNATSTSITLSWNAVSNASSYGVANKLSTASWSSDDNVGTSRTKTYSNLQPGTTYNLRVRAIGDDVNYETSAYTTITVKTPNPTPDPETPSTVVTTNLDVVDAYDNLISLREAIGYANSGDTVTFASSLKGKTIALNSTLGQLKANKSITIDASNLRNSTTSAPGLTISGGGTSKLLSVTQCADVEVVGITFANGFSVGEDGAIYCSDATLSLTNCKISDNNGAVYIADGQVTLTNCEVTGNQYGLSVCEDGVLVATNCLVAENTGSNGAGMKLYGKATLYNCTVVGNTSNSGGDVYLYGRAVLNVYNSIIVGNSAGAASYYVTANAYNTLSNFTGWTGGSNNLTYVSSKPLFKNAASGDYTLAANSQAIDQGNNQYVAATTTVDLAGKTRKVGAKVDLGAYEYPTTPTPDPIKLAAPTNPRVSARTSSSSATSATITVAWDAVANASGYQLIWKNQSDASWTYYTLGASTTSRKMTGLNGSATYVWKVLALGDGDSYINSEYCATQRVYPIEQLPAPTNFRETATTETSITVAWNAVSNAVRYAYSYKLASASSWSTETNAGTNLSRAITGLTPGATYNVRVRAIGDDVNHTNSSYATITVTTEPDDVIKLATPTNTRETAMTETTFTVAWGAVPNASGYKIAWRNTADSANSYITINSGSTTSYKFTGLTKGASYYWKVQALGGGNYVASDYTSARRVTPVSPEPLDTPNADATAKTATTITASWDAVPNASGYRFIWKNQSDAAFGDPIILDASKTSYKMTGLTTSATYVWKVLAIGDGLSHFNSAYCTTQRDMPQQTLAAPTVTSSASTNSITLNWKAVPNAVRYSYSYKLASDAAWPTDTNAGTNLSRTISGLAPNATYNVRVRAIGDGVDYKTSSYTTLTVKTQPKPDPIKLATPTNVDATAKTATTITTSWDAVPNADGYQFIWKNQSDSAYTYVPLDASTTTYKMTGLDVNATYVWKVQALGDNVNYLKSDYCTTQRDMPLQTLAAPTNLRETAKTETTATVAWDAVPNASRYYVYYKHASATTWSSVNAGTNSSYTIPGLAKNSTYDVRVRAIGDNVDYKTSGYSTTIQVETKGQEPLSPPTNMRETAKTETSITVAWDAVANATGYTIAWRNKADASNSYITVGASKTSYKLTGLDPDASYYWKVQALSDGANTDSAYTTARLVKPRQKLATPDNVDATAKTATTITASWDAVPNAASYQLIWKNQSDASYTTVSIAASKTSYKISGLDNSATYIWKVLAVGDGVDYANSYYCATQREKPQQTLATPTATAAGGSTTATVSWDAVPNAESYAVCYRLASESTWSSDVNAGTNLSYTLKGLKQNTMYHVRVRAIGDGVDYKTSAYCATVRVTTSDPQPLAIPANPDATAKTATSITTSWDAVPNATGYRFIWKNQSDASYTTVLLNASTTSYQLSGLNNGATYVWKVLALGDGAAFLNSEYCATQRDMPQQTLVTPSLTVSTATTALTLSWNAVPNAQRYGVSYKLANSSTWTNVNAGTNRSYTIVGLARNTQYDVRVKAVGDDVDYKSVYSTALRAKTGAASYAELDADAEVFEELFDDLDERDLELLAANFAA